MYRQLQYDDRLKLECWLLDGVHKAVIAERLGCTLKTIYNEIERGTYKHLNSDYTFSERYSCDLAESKYQAGLKRRGVDLKIGNDIEFAGYLEHKIVNEKYSPAAALASAGEHKTKICLSTLYSYIRKGIFFTLSNKHLPSPRKKKHTSSHRAKRLSAGTSIEKRPDHINKRDSFGHWEMDSVVGKKNKSKNCLLVFTERLTRYELIFKVPDHSAASVCSVLDMLHDKYPEFRKVFKSITCDNGTEFSNFESMQLHTDVYYCHAYSSWERGSNENCNRLIRRHIPKGTDFDSYSPGRIKSIQKWINNYPRKLLGWHTSTDKIKEQFKKLRLSFRQFEQIMTS